MFILTIVTPEKKIVESLPADEVIVPGDMGELQILEGHSPLLTTLQSGILKYKLNQSSDIKKVAISWGYCEVYPGGVNIMAETAEAPNEIDLKRAKLTLESSEKALLSDTVTPEDVERLQRKIQRARVRIDLVTNPEA
jgi:F-type H+-transporting ATPase subunit epsilon